jgi:hypothetical protein
LASISLSSALDVQDAEFLTSNLHSPDVVQQATSLAQPEVSQFEIGGQAPQIVPDIIVNDQAQQPVVSTESEAF